MKNASLIFGVASGALVLAAAGAANAQSWTDQGFSIGGRTYMDVSSNTFEVNGAKSGSKNGVGFDVKRVYFQVDKKFNDTWSAQLQTDVSPVNQTSGSIAGQGLYVKKAFVKMSIDPAFEVSLGSNELPWIPYAESIYGNRYLENTLLEQNNTGARGTFGTSADWGVHVGGVLPGGIFTYAVSAVNGGGYRDSARSKTMDLEARLSAKYNQWNFAIGAYNGKRAQSKYVGTTLTATPHNAQRFDALAAYVGDRAKVGVEYFNATDWAASAITDTTVGHTKGDKSDGSAVFASYRITPLYKLFARVDNVKPSKTLSPNDKGTYTNFGVETSPLKGITLSLVAKNDRFDHFVGTALTRTEFTEVGVFTEVRY
jgi:hypothetical protein